MANKYGYNTEGGNHALYLLDFYVGGHHIFKVGMSANPHIRARHITASLFENNKDIIHTPLYKFVNEVVHWEFKSVWKSQSKGAYIEELLLNELKKYSESLFKNSLYDGRVWNTFDGMYEAYPIKSKDVYSIKKSLQAIIDKETKDNSFFVRTLNYEASYHLSLTAKNNKLC